MRARAAATVFGSLLVAACGTGWPDGPRIGDACGDGACGATLTCVRDDEFPSGLCTKACTAHDDCRLDGDVAGFCTGRDGAPGLCLRSCLVGTDRPCGRDDGWTCAPTPTHAGACLPDCRVGDVPCPELSACHATTGRCAPIAGNAGGFESCDGITSRCAPGLSCLYYPGDDVGRCHADCATDGDCPVPQVCALEAVDGRRACTRTCDPSIGDCPEGLRCRRRAGTEVGICTSGETSGPRDEFERCSRALNELCRPGLTCLVKRPEEGQGLCAFECATAFDCPPARSCNVPVEGALRACTLPCSQPGALDCPDGATCLYGECLPD